MDDRVRAERERDELEGERSRPREPATHPVLALQRAAGNQAVARMLQRMPVLNDRHARDEVRTALVARGYRDVTHRLISGIGSLTIRDHVGIDNLVRILVQQGNDVDRVIRVINNATAADLHVLTTDVGSGAVFRELGNLVPPSDQQIGRAYGTFLANGRNGTHLGLGAAYVPGMYDAFRAAMLRNGGQYWDYNAAVFQPMTEALRAQHALGAGPMGGAAFSAQIFGTPAGQQLDLLTGQFAPVPNWQFNPNLASRLELDLALGGGGGAVPVGYSRPYDAGMRAAIAAVHAAPAAVNHVIGGPNAQVDLTTLMAELARAAQPARVLSVLGLVLGNAPIGNTFTTALNHIDDLAPAAGEIMRMQAGTLVNLPFGNRAGGLRGHFIKHPLGCQDPPHVANGLSEGGQWMTRLGLAPNGLITRGHLPNLQAVSRDEWAIFAQHAHYYATYYSWYYSQVTAGSRPTTAAETNALITYLQGHRPDANHLATQFERLYEANVSQAFDAAPNRYLYYDAGNLKISAHDGTLFMVAAWNGATFDLSTGFIPQSGPAAQYAADMVTRITDV